MKVYVVEEWHAWANSPAPTILAILDAPMSCHKAKLSFADRSRYFKTDMIEHCAFEVYEKEVESVEACDIDDIEDHEKIADWKKRIGVGK